MAYKADSVQTGTVTAAVVKDLVRVWWRCVTLPPSEPIVFKNCPGDVFKGGNHMVGGETPGVVVLSLGGQSVMIDVTGTKGYFQVVLHSLLWCSSVAMVNRARCRLWSWRGDGSPSRRGVLPSVTGTSVAWQNAFSRTSMFVMKSLQRILRMVKSQRF